MIQSKKCIMGYPTGATNLGPVMLDCVYMSNVSIYCNLNICFLIDKEEKSNKHIFFIN